MAAKERKAEVKEKDKAQKHKHAEDADWAAAGEGARTKAQAKKDDQVQDHILAVIPIAEKRSHQPSNCLTDAIGSITCWCSSLQTLLG